MRFRKTRTKLAKWLVGEDTKRNEVKIVHHHSDSIILRSQKKINTRDIPEKFREHLMETARKDMMMDIMQECLNNNLFDVHRRNEMADPHSVTFLTELRVVKPLKQ